MLGYYKHADDDAYHLSHNRGYRRHHAATVSNWEGRNTIFYSYHRTAPHTNTNHLGRKKKHSDLPCTCTLFWCIRVITHNNAYTNPFLLAVCVCVAWCVHVFFCPVQIAKYQNPNKKTLQIKYLTEMVPQQIPLRIFSNCDRMRGVSLLVRVLFRIFCLLGFLFFIAKPKKRFLCVYWFGKCARECECVSNRNSKTFKSIWFGLFGW